MRDGWIKGDSHPPNMLTDMCECWWEGLVGEVDRCRGCEVGLLVDRDVGYGRSEVWMFDGIHPAQN